MKKNIILIHGAPGSGKDTNAYILSHHIESSLHISVGDLFRSTTEASSGIHARQMSHDRSLGHMSSDKTCIGVVLDKISTERQQLFLLTGFPQRENEIRLFVQGAESNGMTILGTIYLNAHRDICLPRMRLRGLRAGEKLTSVNNEEYYLNRFNEFERKKDALIKNLSQFMPIQQIKSNDDIKVVSARFRNAYDGLAGLTNPKILLTR
jgi:adenylate kinase family enzyme